MNREIHEISKAWDKLSPAERKKALKTVRRGIREWPQEVKEEVGRAIRRGNQ